jgi:hypothetical protein
MSPYIPEIVPLDSGSISLYKIVIHTKKLHETIDSTIIKLKLKMKEPMFSSLVFEMIDIPKIRHIELESRSSFGKLKNFLLIIRP